MDGLKLVAFDETDLQIVSAHVQDAVAKVGDLDYSATAKRFLLPMRRFVWEGKSTFLKPRPNERRSSLLLFDRVLSARTAGIRRDRPDEVLSLLTLRFRAGELPGGDIELVFSADATVRLAVECIEVRLSDLGGAWEAASRPSHKV
ncbi:MAG: DUF2948 family protein [Rhizobiaceae bacterium]|nr:DUF2948 family protein [Rhizobiaceae bacterium]